MTSRQFKTLMTVFRSGANQAERSIEQVRADFDRFMASMPAAESVNHQAVDVDGVEAEWLIPDSLEDSMAEASGYRALLFFHGGGFGSGSLTSHRGLAARLAAATGIRCLSVAYRLAPEHPFPAAPDDCRHSYEWLLDQGVDPRLLVIGGDSAGGGLALTTLQSLRDTDRPLPAAWFALSPWVDLTSNAASIRERAASDPILNPAGLRKMTELYLDGVPEEHPLASPLFADLHGLPPALIQVGTAEILHDDSITLAAELEAAGSAVELDIWDEMFHGWQLFGGMLPEAEEAIARLATWIDRQLSE